MSNKTLEEFSNKWLIQIVDAARNVFGNCIYIESAKHPCGWDRLEFEDIEEIEDVLEYEFSLYDITNYIYEDHLWDGLTLKEILTKNSPKWGFEGID